MHHSLPLITTVAFAFALAVMFGFIALKLKLPTLVGYLMAGIVIGPFTPGIFADVNIAQELAELGIMLLMFGVGLHFSLNDLLKVRAIAIPGAIVQIVVATLLGAAVAILWGWSYGSSLIFGLSLSVASTVVLLRALEERGAIESINGHIAVGWLLVEDLVMVVVLVLLPPFSFWLGGSVGQVDATHPFAVVLSITLAKVAAFILLMLVVGKRIFPIVLWHVASTGSRELFTLCIIAAAISIAYIASMLFGVSFALGAFFAGMVLRESSFSNRAAEDSLPLRDVFAVLFFVSVGMLFNPMVLVHDPLKIFEVICIIVLGKSVAAFALVLLFRYPFYTALIVSASLAQIGEFSFILAELGVRFGVLPVEARSFILAGALISIAMNPLIFRLIEPIKKWTKRHSKWSVFLEHSDDLLAQLPVDTPDNYRRKQVVLVGYGRVGERVAQSLIQKEIPYVVVDNNRELIAKLRADGITAIYGDAADPFVLEQAQVSHASMLMILISNTIDVRKMIGNALKLNPDIDSVVRMHNEREAHLLQADIEGKVFFAEEEIARNIGAYVLKRYDKLHEEKE
jgi:CPA2 family monovalent cation:H+ antiporter-2